MNTYTIASSPPRRKSVTQRRSRWAEMFNEARAHPGEWRRLVEPMKRTTAAQVASDIRNAHTRDLSKARLRGLHPDDRWEAAWGQDEKDPEREHFYVWLRYLGPHF